MCCSHQSLVDFLHFAMYNENRGVIKLRARKGPASVAMPEWSGFARLHFAVIMVNEPELVTCRPVW
jgi:hypothetical protein